jgi:hypothetical protein
MPELSEVKVKITTEADSKGIEQAEKSFLGFSQKAVDASKKLTIGIGAIATAVGAFAISTVGDYQAQEDALSRLQTGINNVKSATDKSITGLTDYASALQMTTRFADEQIESGMAMLTTFQLNQNTIKTLTPGMLDMAEAFRKSTGETMDLEQIGVLFGKSMGSASDNIDGLVTSLRKMGVIMTEEQKLVFKFGTESERAATIAQIMDLNFKGFAEGGATTSAGKLQILNNQFGEIKETVGKFVVDAILPLTTILTTQLVPAFNAVITFLQNNQGIFIAIGVIIATIVIPAFVSWGIAAIGAAVGTFLALAPIQLIIIAIAAVLGLLYLAWNSNFLGIQDITQAVVTWFMTFVWPTLQKIFNWIGQALTVLGQVFTNVWNLIVKPLLLAFVTWFNVTFWLPLKALFDLMTLALNKMGLTWGDVWEGVKKVVFGVFNAIVGFIKEKINFIIDAINLLIKGANAVGGKIPGYTHIGEMPRLAQGTSYFRGGAAMVGEEGPEIVNLPRGSRVTPNGQAGGMVVNQTNNIYSSEDMDLMLRQLAYAVATS